jgi:hypothetical protein
MRFCFYSEYKDLKGGYTTLILTLIKELYAQEQKVALINYKEGLIAQELRKDGVEVTIIEKDEIHKKNIKKYFSASDIFIIPRFYEFLKILFGINPKVIYYDINDYICRISDYRFAIRLPFLGKKLIKKLLAHNGLIFMDDTGINNLQREFGIHVKEPIFLPIAIPDEKENLYFKQSGRPDGAINLTYIGRSVDWKMYPLKKIIDDCLETDEDINLKIVVDDLISFKSFIDLDLYKNRKLNIEVYENLLPSDIRTFLITNSNLHFGMGTAALHAASIGIPTILMDFSTRPFPENYTYRWLYDTDSCSLGKNIERVPVPEGLPLKNILNVLKDDIERNRISKKSFQYIATHHSASSVVKTLIAYSNLCSFRLKEAKNLIPYYFKIHSIIKKLPGVFSKNKQHT